MKEKVVLKSTHPEVYGDLEVECRVIENTDISSYLESLPSENKFVAYKHAPISARQGVLGERVKTVLKTMVDGREYILHEEENTVKDRDGLVDIVVTNINSTSNEQYVVKNAKFFETYVLPSEGTSENNYGTGWVPVYDPREFTLVDENVIIVTSWGEKVVCLKGSYIVTYNAMENDYNAVERDSFLLTYTLDSSLSRKRS